MTKEQFDEACNLTTCIAQTKERIKHLEDMDGYELLDIKQPSVGIVVIRGEIKDAVIRLILKDEHKTLSKLEKALEVL